jgi:hypothetical protein
VQAPIVVIAIVLAICITVYMLIRYMRKLRGVRPTVRPGVQEVTAVQLAGLPVTGTGADASAGGASGQTTERPARQPRRNRRTPSQMSTTSLPAYAKDAGDEELVIFRYVPVTTALVHSKKLRSS